MPKEILHSQWRRKEFESGDAHVRRKARESCPPRFWLYKYN